MGNDKTQKEDYSENDETQLEGFLEKTSKGIYAQLYKEVLKAAVAVVAGAVVVFLGPQTLITVGIAFFALSLFYMIRGAVVRYLHNSSCKHIQETYLPKDKRKAESKSKVLDLSLIQERAKIFYDRHAGAIVTRKQIDAKKAELKDSNVNVSNLYSEFYKELFNKAFEYYALKYPKGIVSEESLLEYGGYIYLKEKKMKGACSTYECDILKQVGVDYRYEGQDLKRIIREFKQSESDYRLSKNQIEAKKQFSFAEMLAHYEYWEENFHQGLLEVLDSVEKKAGKSSIFSRFMSYFSQRRYEMCFLGGNVDLSGKSITLLLNIAADLNVDFKKFITFRSCARFLAKKFNSLEPDEKTKLCVRYSKEISNEISKYRTTARALPANELSIAQISKQNDLSANAALQPEDPSAAPDPVRNTGQIR